MFLEKYKNSTGYNDTHHILKTSFCKQKGLNPDIYFNMIWISREAHGNLHTPSTNYNRYKNNYYCDVLISIFNILEIKGIEYTDSEYELVKTLLFWCFNGYDKKSKFYQNNYEEIINGYKILEKYSKEIVKML